ncbi:MAG TPA: 4Fe-4S binding protein [Spirochaetales bacterium]|nr:4Fe-4S binding protein [Spirochaetales bacterium]HRY54915.1 4Fe-4S binding protein [Spirochaetia bacterium]HRZ63502.1 4Fe-4S binding protein [Spirochaetia bacterium]
MSRSRNFAGPIARAARIAAAALALAGATLSFLLGGELGDTLSRAISSWQLFPAAARIAALALGGAGISGLATGATLLAASALFGRWYCAALCPLGSLQDAASLLGGARRRARGPLRGLRAASLAAVLGLAALGALGLASWLDPWSLFGRFLAYDIQPLLRLALRADTPALRPELVAAAGLAMSLVLLASALSGRWFCGNLCPVGAVLGILNRFAPLRLRLDEGACVSCGRCSSVCRATCVDGARKRLDPTRCVYCLACLAACPTGAVRYGRGPRASGHAAARAGPREAGPLAAPLSRRGFVSLLAGGSLALGAAALSRRSLSLLAPRIEGGGVPRPVTPPGSGSAALFAERCTACGLCVSRCPAKILRPSLGRLGLAGFLAPRLDYSVSYCQYDCVACLEACPSGALERLALGRKRLTKIGDATLIRERCVVIKNRTKCGACAEHCPTGAVRMIVGESRLPEPVFDGAICIGCGACHHACPVEPDKAISVAGLAEHRLAEKPEAGLFDTPAHAPPGLKGEEPTEASEAFPF